MAGDWIKMRSDLQTHPKVVRIASALNADRLRTVGGLHAVWCLFDAHSIDGQLDGYTPAALDDLIGWRGFSEALAGVKWLEVGEGFLALPRFEDHNGKSAKRRAQESERKRADRAQDDRNTSASDADKNRTREEKSRVDKEKEEKIRRGTRLPSDWTLPSEWANEAHEILRDLNRPDISVALEAQKFKDHWTSEGEAKKDWMATWRNWIRNSVNFNKPNGKAKGNGQTGTLWTGIDQQDYSRGVNEDGSF